MIVDGEKSVTMKLVYRVSDSEQIRKSNVISVDLPLARWVNAPFPDRYVPYISVKKESTAPDVRLQRKSNLVESPGSVSIARADATGSSHISCA